VSVRGGEKQLGAADINAYRNRGHKAADLDHYACASDRPFWNWIPLHADEADMNASFNTGSCGPSQWTLREISPDP